MKMVILSSVLLFACGGSDLATRSSAIKPAIYIHTEDVDGVARDVFAVTDYAVVFVLETPKNEKGPHWATLLIRTPGRGPYQEWEFSYAAGVPPEGAQLEASLVGKEYRIEKRLPVLGTWIHTRGIVGVWSATLRIDGEYQTPVPFTVSE